jgi:hypothetical protein
VRTIELNLVCTLVLSLLVYFVGQWLVDRVQLLKRLSILGGRRRWQPGCGGARADACIGRAWRPP